MMMSADYAIAARGQFKIGFNETAIGITMPLAGQDIARARLTPAHFNLCLLLAEIQDPEGALHAGFLNQLVDADELMNEAKQRAETYSKFDMNVFKQSKLSMHAKLLEDIERNIRRDHEINLATPIVKPE